MLGEKQGSIQGGGSGAGQRRPAVRPGSWRLAAAAGQPRASHVIQAASTAPCSHSRYLIY